MRMNEVLVLLFLILLNGFFVLSEMALVAAKRSRLQSAAEQGKAGAKSAIALMEDPTSLLSAVQICITLISLVTGIYSGASFAAPVEALLVAYGVPPGDFAEKLAYGIVVVPVTFVTLTVGELVPKRVALLHAETLAIYVAPIMRLLTRLLAPFVWLLRFTVNMLLKLLPISSAPQAAVTEDDVRALVVEGTRAGVFLASERRLLEGVMALADRKVGSIMIPRQDVIWLDIEDPIEELWQQAKDSGHARFLVARGKVDNLLGMVTLADLSEAVHSGRLDDKDLEPPLHIPDSISVLQLLDQFQRSSTHLAVVTDEYGEIEGITTPIDILKAIAGELPELGSRERPEAIQRADGSWLVDGHLPIEELQRRLNRRDMVGKDFHTVAGFVLARLGRIPKAGDVVTWRDLKIEIMDMDGVRIDKILLSTVGEPARRLR
jgi:magnesium and cobalt exporter, CNNM family